MFGNIFDRNIVASPIHLPCFPGYVFCSPEEILLKPDFIFISLTKKIFHMNVIKKFIPVFEPACAPLTGPALLI